MKNNTKKKQVVIGFAAILFVFAIFIIWVPPFISRANTTYIEGFSYSQLDRIKIGMSEQEVIVLLGKPYSKTDDNDASLYYSKPKSKLSDFLGWESITVWFDKNRKVTGIGKNIFFN
jgi:outer membrane protein assembly factor BamE (lipoprotein component of BamABCDE complex)